MKINSNSQYYTALAKIESFTEKGFKNLTKAETIELKKLSVATEDYETLKYPMPLQASLRDLLEQ